MSVHMKVTYDRMIKCVLACVNAEGCGEFVPVKVACNMADYDLGNHYGAVKKWAAAHDYESPYVVVDEVKIHPATVLRAFDWNIAPLIDPVGEYYPF